MSKLRVFEAFAGYGSQSLALKKYNVDYENVGILEIDVNAIIAYESLHCNKDIEYPPVEFMLERLDYRNIGLNFKTNKNPWGKLLEGLKKNGKVTLKAEENIKRIYKACVNSKNKGDISKILPNEIPKMDLFIFSFPCQDISGAGKQKGLEEGSGSRSSLLWECEKIIESKRPKYLMMENVKALVGKKFKPNFDKWLEVLDNLGYNNYWKVINAKYCGVPQNRERVFCVSILKEHDNFNFHFYDDFDSGVRLKDILEEEVDEKYYLSEEKTRGLIEALEEKGYTDYQKAYTTGGNSYCIDASYAKGTSAGDVGKSRRIHVIEPNKSKMVGMLDIKGNESIRGVYEPGGVSPALTTMQGGNRQPKIVEACAIRGRNPINPKSRESGLETVQMLEVNKNPNISNCLTTVQKDSLLLESNSIIKEGLLEGSNYNQNKVVYNQKGVSPTLSGLSRCGNEPKILENQLKFMGGIGAKDRVGDGKNLSRNVPTGNRVYDSEGIAVTQTAQGGGLGGATGNYLHQFRIRKLSPRECFRLMNVNDNDIDKIQATGISNSKQYKMAGNSIVVASMKFLEQLK